MRELDFHYNMPIYIQHNNFWGCFFGLGILFLTLVIEGGMLLERQTDYIWTIQGSRTELRS